MANAQNLFGDAMAAFRSGNVKLAERLFKQILRIDKRNVPALNLLAIVLIELGRYEEAEKYITAAIKLNATSDLTFYNYGLLLKNLRRPSQALVQFNRALQLNSNVPETWNNRGTVHSDLKDYSAAIADFDKAIALNANYAPAHANKGKALAALERYEDSLKACDRALSIKADLAEAWIGRGNSLVKLGRHADALEAFERALVINGRMADAWYGRGIALSHLRRNGEAIAMFENALSIRSDFVEAWCAKGESLLDLDRHDESLGAYEKALLIDSKSAEAWLGRGNVYFILKDYENAFLAYDKALNLSPNLFGLEGARLASKMAICDWNKFDADRMHLIGSIQAGRVSAAPFILLAIESSPMDQLQCGKVWAERVFPNSGELLWRGDVYKNERIRVGYVSADFHQHATAYLMAGLFESHDRNKFEVTGFSFGVDDHSEMRQRLKHAFDHFIDVRSIGDEEVARTIRSREIEILVDLKGITQDARAGIFVRRPAPIQVNYLGYPGTIASEHFDYVIGDGRIIQEGDRAYYSEKVVTLPFSYQANDDKRVISDKALSKAECGLPDDSFVYCCFNQAYKIAPEIFDCWMSILREVDGSVLWLFENNAAASKNLRKEAEKRGIESRRLIFATGMPPAEHLARHRQADLFLDTLPYNAHTTASDALWAGLPVLTLAGETFASRVGASLLAAVGLPELITSTREEYVALAIALAKNRERLAAIKARLVANRLTMPLFNTAMFAKHLEAAYEMMSDRYRRGLPPDHLAIGATL